MNSSDYLDIRRFGAVYASTLRSAVCDNCGNCGNRGSCCNHDSCCGGGGGHSCHGGDKSNLILASYSSTVNLDWLAGSVLHIPTPITNFTVNVVNLPTTLQQVYTVKIVINQGGSGHYADTLQISGVGQIIQWARGQVPIPVASKQEVATFTLMNMSTTCTPWWIVYGDYMTYG